MKFTIIMAKIILSSLLLIGLLSFCSHTKAPDAKEIDYVSVPYLSNTEMRALKEHLNEKHIIEAHKSKITTPIENKHFFNENADDICRKADLQKIESNELFAIAHLTYSLPYLNEKSADFLELLGERMEESFEEKGVMPYRFVLTSVLRTKKDQRLLQKVNTNAAVTETSHYFGTSFDISQTRFLMKESDKAVYSYRLRNILARELIRLQDEGECYVILESREKCFHVTVRQ